MNTNQPKSFENLVKSYSLDELLKQKGKTINAIESTKMKGYLPHMLPVWIAALDILNNEIQSRHE